MPNKALIGVCGKAGSGKDTAAQLLIDNYGFTRLALADPIRDVIRCVFKFDEATITDRVLREQPLDFPPVKKFINPTNLDEVIERKWSVRKLLQFIGTEMFREMVHPDIWLYSLAQGIKQRSLTRVIVPDIRFPNEREALKKYLPDFDIQYLKVEREGCDGSVGLEGHESEKYDLGSNWVIDNNGTLEELYCKVEAFIFELGINKELP